MAPPRFLADEMLGRLARYLRFVGCDVAYVRGLDDRAIAALARAEGRVLLTRDRALADRTPEALLLASPTLSAQWAAVRSARPDVPAEPRFERCTLCNGLLAPYRLGTDPSREDGIPRDRVAEGLALFACAGCGHLFWDGSHTSRIRAQLATWAAAEAQ